MKLLIILSMSTALFAAAEGQKKPDKSAPAVIKPLEIPKGAVESEPGTYRFTDSAGKKWIYRKTPFGVARQEDTGAPSKSASAPAPAATQTADSYSDVKAFEDGENIRFERPGPFGVSQWKSPKSSLNEMERAVWNREKNKPAAKSMPKKD